MGMLIYAEEHEGELPEVQGWEEKVNQCINEDKAFSCPSCKKHYVYLGNGQKKNTYKEPSKVIVFICEGDHLGKTNVAFLDGHIYLWDTEEVNAAVEAAWANGSLPLLK
jgi:prepilin-type processing-associated H-X9-DG protein